MQIHVHTSNGMENKETLERWADAQIRHLLGHWVQELTRVEVHLSDESRDAKSAPDKRCALEARVPHHAPVAVSRHATTVDEALRGAADKLKRALDSMLGRRGDQRDRESIRKDTSAAIE